MDIVGRYFVIAIPLLLMGCHMQGDVGYRADGGGAAQDTTADETETAPDSMKIILDTSESGAYIVESVSNFPVLIRLDAPNFDMTAAGEEEENLRFENQSGESLPHVIQRFDEDSNRALVWVLLDRIEANSDSQFITMYIGDGAEGDTYESDAVFGIDNGFSGVCHLDEEGSSNPFGYRDSSGNGNHGTGIGISAVANVTGIVGSAQALDGTAFIEVDGAFGEPENITLSGWASVNALEGEFITIGDHVVIRFMENWIEANYQNGRTWVRVQGEVDYLDTGWHHVACVVDVVNGTFFLFFDGKVVAWNTTDVVPIVYSPMFDRTLLGTHIMEEYFLVGTIDELRVHAVARSESWIKLAYENQRPDRQTLVEFP